MALQDRWESVSPQALTSNGNAYGVVLVSDVSDFRKGMVVAVSSDTQPTVLGVVSLVDVTGNKLVVRQKSLNSSTHGGILDLSSYLVVDNATVSAKEQSRSAIDPNGLERDTFEDEPVVAKRVINVTGDGELVSEANPLSFDLSQITKEEFVSDGRTGLDTVSMNDTIDVAWDDMEVTAIDAKDNPTEIVYRDNGVIVRTLTLTYDAKSNLTRVQKS